MSLAKHLARGVLALCAAVALCAAPAFAQAPPEPEGYRLDNYHAPTPATLKGATRARHPAGV